jgi:type IV pilus assembly protein PilC
MAEAVRQTQVQPRAATADTPKKKVVIGGKVEPNEIVKFVRQFATMIDAGLPLVQCLDILSSQEPNPLFRETLRDIKNTVEGGSTFSEALGRHPKIFDDLFVNLVHAGEVGGILDTILQRLAVYIEKRVKLTRQVRGALSYPIAVIIILGLVITVLMTFVIPAFENMFAEFGAKDALPKLTKFVIALSRSFVSYLPLFVLAGAGGLFAFRAAYKNRNTRKTMHRIMLKAPIFGPVFQKIAVSRFTRTLGTLLGSGVPILEAMDIVAKTSGNLVIEDGLQFVRQRISEGKNMGEPLTEAAVFPPMVVQMISVGEQTGALDTMLNKIADFYEEEVDVAVASLTSLLEPILMLIVGTVVGVVLMAMYLPIFDLAGNIKAS